jgi:aspartyl-tRNA(Asn)/glutamyl-tRNA(Gln) amidotransferase subunit C
MADISRDDVLKLARLSKLKLEDEEADRLVKELDEIVKYVEQINEVDVSNLNPTDQVTGLVNVMRSDEEINYQAKPDELLKNTPAVNKNQIKVKRVLQ